MKNKAYQKYIAAGITAFLVTALAIGFFFFIFKNADISAGFKNIIGILQPIVYGIILAYLLNPIYNRCTKLLERLLAKTIKRPKILDMIVRLISTSTVLLITFLAMFGFSLIVPQIGESLLGIVLQMPDYIVSLEQLLTNFIDNNPIIAPYINDIYLNITSYLRDWLDMELIPTINIWAEMISLSILGVFNIIVDIFIGIIVMIYLLNDKTKLIAQFKKIIYSIIAIEKANDIVDNLRYTHRVFGGFINGKILDSFIIGLITLAFMHIADMPHPTLIGVIIGLTNIIPFFGPFIGAIPSAILILFENPMACLYFIIFILILQQVDGNIIGPKILGNSTGLPSIWVLFSILLFGGLFGFVGMIIAVPFFAVIYGTIVALVNRSLRKKQLPTESEKYYDLHYISKNKELIINKDIILPNAMAVDFMDITKEDQSENQNQQ